MSEEEELAIRFYGKPFLKLCKRRQRVIERMIIKK